MLLIIKKLLKPLKYLQIKHSQKRWIDFYIPIILAIIATIAICSSPVPIKLIGKDGLIGLVNGLLQMLIGFFVASLAAVATFQRKGLDEDMVGDAPTLDGKNVKRRQFICYMFGYLAFMSLLLYFGSGIFELSMGSLKLVIGDIFPTVKVGLIFLYMSLFINIILTTLLSLYYLTDRLVREELPTPVKNE